MNTVTLRHPEAGQTQVPASAVPHWRARGWEPVTDVAQEQASEQEPKPSGRSRRRSSEESEQ